ncbi:hypothetical protein HanXRQr2_Chr00c252g0834351 [Helianthus annuus]|uniref:Uncharacterized protein n=1 Tax=Helianthus annuus TaxID=4232 RepID=A0A251TNP5_HELAN|nr:hypothetical protein HanXRQr2_Chr00c252g0834351 [Helianthus annuus]
MERIKDNYMKTFFSNQPNQRIIFHFFPSTHPMLFIFHKKRQRQIISEGKRC